MALISVPTATAHAQEQCANGSGFASTTANMDVSEDAAIGVSLKNTLTPTIDQLLSPVFVPQPNHHWYFLRVNYSRAEKLYNELKDRQNDFLLWMPYQKEIRYEKGSRITELQPLFKGNIFIYSTYENAFSLTHRAPDGYSFVDFVYDHTKQNLYGRDHVLQIPFHQMRSFAIAANVQHPWAHIVSEEQIHFRPGGLVRVIGGNFKGVEGRVARVFGQTRVVVTIKGIANYATAYVSQKDLMPIEKTTAELEAEQHKPVAGNSLRNRVKRHEVKVGSRVVNDRPKRKWKLKAQDL